MRVTDDLKIANVYLSFLENKKPVEEVLKIIKSQRNNIRHHVSLNIKLRYIPQLRFNYDESFMHAQRIDDLIQKIHKDD